MINELFDSTNPSISMLMRKSRKSKDTSLSRTHRSKHSPRDYSFNRTKIDKIKEILKKHPYNLRLTKPKFFKLKELCENSVSVSQRYLMCLYHSVLRIHFIEKLCKKVYPNSTSLRTWKHLPECSTNLAASIVYRVAGIKSAGVARAVLKT